jgi:hypothetical protein
MTAPQNRRILSPLSLAISAAAFATSAVIGSLLGNNGTLIGGVAGAVVSTGSTSVYEHLAGQAHHLSKLRQFEPGWLRAAITHIPRKVLVTAATSAALVTGGGYAAIAATETGILHKPLSAAITGRHATGTSFTGTTTTTPSPRATLTPEPTPSVTSCGTGGTQCPTSPPSSKTSAAPSPTQPTTSNESSKPTSPPSSAPPQLLTPTR